MRAARPGGGSGAGGRNRPRDPRRKLIGRPVLQARMRTPPVVLPTIQLAQCLRMRYTPECFHVQAFPTQRPVKPFVLPVLPRAAGIYMPTGHACLLEPPLPTSGRSSAATRKTSHHVSHASGPIPQSSSRPHPLPVESIPSLINSMAISDNLYQDGTHVVISRCG